MKKTKIKLEITGETLDVLRGRWVLLDTNVFIDAFSYANEFEELFSEIKKVDCTIMSINAVVVEFLKGAKSISEMHSLRKYIDYIVDLVLPHRDDNSFFDPQLLIAYRQKISKPSYTDYLLAETLMKHKRNVLLLTGNHRDFPTTVFDRKGLVTLERECEVKTFGIYQFSNVKYKEQLTVLLENEGRAK